MRDEMKKGDQAFFYHSNCKEPGIAGTYIYTLLGVKYCTLLGLLLLIDICYVQA